MNAQQITRAEAIKRVRWILDDTGNAMKPGENMHAIIRENAPDNVQTRPGLCVNGFRHASRIVLFGTPDAFTAVSVHSYLDVPLTDAEALELCVDFMAEELARIDADAPEAFQVI